MYCKKCGEEVSNEMKYCPNCGTLLNDRDSRSSEFRTKINNSIDDGPSKGYAIVGFLAPIVGLILYLVHNSNNRPLKAKSAAKGAIVGVVTRIIVSILITILYIGGIAFLGSVIMDDDHIDHVTETFTEHSLRELMEEYVDVEFGDFSVDNAGYYNETSLDILVTNKANEQYTYYITIEAVNKDGSRLGTDSVYANTLNPNQSISLEAFKFVDESEIEDYKNARFKVLEINSYNY